ncbi:MAG: 16S rRNA (guanine(966)-N(2))-methyltransferase RsmD [Clostridia bacterium]|nr:16S rRNA (guanine(966)-N(2))-methyltransferase RsmD [Clostridia bacterium]
MRIISGKVRGLKLKTPAGEDTRPTLDRVKEAVFSMILPFIIDSKVLDLFAGSGALGIESLSRGALSAVFVDSSADAIDCINSNVNSARFGSVSLVKKVDSISFLKENKECFDIIFLDPPYQKNMYTKSLEGILTNNALSNEGIVVVEYDNSLVELTIPDEFIILKEKKYGKVGIVILKRG